MNFENNTSMKTLGPQTARLVTTLYEEYKLIFRLEDVRRILHIEKASARSLMRKLVNRGVVTRLKPGLFILVPFELGKENEYMGNPLILARELTEGKDYYLSHGTAMEIHGMVTQPQFVVHVMTMKKRRSINILGTEFQFINCKKEHFFGMSEHWVSKQEKVMVSNREKTIIDCLRQTEHCGGITEAAKGIWIRRLDLNVDRLVKYAARMKIGAVIRRLGYILEIYGIGTPENHKTLQGLLTESYVKLDPILPSEGKFIRKWRLQLNVSPNELLSVVRT
ncbi:MAG: transcriptional regulator [Thermodesulfobacteriota bacterium]|nr:transcriptional regulator [Thermodesulfobacteriota bacterium]